MRPPEASSASGLNKRPTVQYEALLATEGVGIHFTEEGIARWQKLPGRNERAENIGDAACTR